MTNTIADFEKADVILVTGSNTTENHPVLSTYIKRAVKFNGTKLIVVDPRRIKMADHAHKYLIPHLGTDVVWINGMMHVIIKENLHDKAYIEERTENFAALAAAVERFTPEYVEEITGIAADDIVEIARMYAGAERGSIAYCMGITQHTTGTDGVMSLANLAMLCGNMGIEGGGVNPLRGQNNVQGSCDMGGLPNVYPGYQKVTDETVVAKMERAWGVTGLSKKVGLKNTEMIPLALEGKIRALYILGENPMISDPDANHTKKCFEALDFLVVQDLFLNDTAKLADVVLPTKCFAEKEGTFTNTERKIQRVHKVVEAPATVRDDWEITCEIARRMGYDMRYENAAQIMEEIASVTPSYGGISYDRLERGEQLHWPCLDREHAGTPILHAKTFARGKGAFQAIDFREPAERVDAEYPLYLTTGRVLYQYHSCTMTDKTDDINQVSGECFIEMTPRDAHRMGVENGAMAKVASRRGEIEARVRVTHRISRGNVFLPFHFSAAAANKLTIAALDPAAKIPEYKVCAVKVIPA